MEPVDARRSLKLAIKVERARVTEPARQDRLRVMVARCCEQVGRRSWAAVEEFVAAAHRKIGFRAVQIDFDRSGRMAEIPHHQRANLVRFTSDLGHVANARGLVMHLRQQKHRDVLVERIKHCFRRDFAAFERAIAEIDEALHHIIVGREIAGLRQQNLAVLLQG